MADFPDFQKLLLEAMAKIAATAISGSKHAVSPPPPGGYPTGTQVPSANSGEYGPRPGQLLPNLLGSYPKLWWEPELGTKGFDMASFLGIFAKHGVVCLSPAVPFYDEDSAPYELTVPQDLPQAVALVVEDAAKSAALSDAFRDTCRVLFVVSVSTWLLEIVKNSVPAFVEQLQARLDSAFQEQLDMLPDGAQVAPTALAWPRAAVIPTVPFPGTGINFGVKSFFTYAGRLNPHYSPGGSGKPGSWSFFGYEPAILLGRVVIPATGTPARVVQTIGTWDSLGWQITGRNFLRLLYSGADEELLGPVMDKMKETTANYDPAGGCALLSSLDKPLSYLKTASHLVCWQGTPDSPCPEYSEGFMRGVNYHMGGTGMLDYADESNSGLESRFPALAAADGFDAVALPIRLKVNGVHGYRFSLMNRKVGWWDGELHRPTDNALQTKTVQGVLDTLPMILDGDEYDGLLDATPSMVQFKEIVDLCKKCGHKVLLRVYLSPEDKFRAGCEPKEIGSGRTAGVSPDVVTDLDEWNIWWRKWFQGYGAALAIIARLAEELQVDCLDIGAELNSSVGIRYWKKMEGEDPAAPSTWLADEDFPTGPNDQPAFENGPIDKYKCEEVDGWKELIEIADNGFSGLLMYSANYSPDEDEFEYPNGGKRDLAGNWNPQFDGCYKSVGFWNLLDYIGIDVYKRVSAQPPTFAEALQDWLEMICDGDDQPHYGIEAWIDKMMADASKPLGKSPKVVISEFGLRSYQGAAEDPNTDPDPGDAAGKLCNPASWQEQATYLAAALESMQGRSWLAGAFLYHWGTQWEADQHPLLVGSAKPSGGKGEPDGYDEKFARGYPIVGKDAEIVFFARNWRVGDLLLP